MNIIKILGFLMLMFVGLQSAYSGSNDGNIENPSKATVSDTPISDNTKSQANGNNPSSPSNTEAENLRRARLGLDPIAQEPTEEDCARFRAQREALRQALQNPGSHPNTPTQLNISPAEEICMQREKQNQVKREDIQSDQLRCSGRAYITRLDEVRALQARACERWAERTVDCYDRYTVDNSNKAGSILIPFFILYGPAADAQTNAARLRCLAGASVQKYICEAKLSARCQGSDERVYDWQEGDVRYSEMAQADRAVCSSFTDYFNSCPSVPMNKADSSLLEECLSCGYGSQQ